MKNRVAIAAVVLIAVAGGAWWWRSGRTVKSTAAPAPYRAHEAPIDPSVPEFPVRLTGKIFYNAPTEFRLLVESTEPATPALPNPSSAYYVTVHTPRDTRYLAHGVPSARAVIVHPGNIVTISGGEVPTDITWDGDIGDVRSLPPKKIPLPGSHVSVLARLLDADGDSLRYTVVGAPGETVGVRLADGTRFGADRAPSTLQQMVTPGQTVLLTYVAGPENFATRIEPPSAAREISP